MKKPVILLTILCIAAFFQCGILFPAYGAEDAITRKEAVDLIQKAVDIRTNVGTFFQWYEGGASRAFFFRDIDLSDRIRPQNTPEVDPEYKFYSFFKVKDGYDPEGVKRLINDTFSEQLASAIIENIKNFFDLYYEENGVWFYGYYYGGDKFSFEDGDRQYTYFEPAEIEDMKILKNIGGNAVVSVPVHRFHNQTLDGDENTARLTTDVFFFLTNESGKWKISGTDFSNMLFRADRTVDSSGELTAEFVRESIVAAVSDIYSMTRLANYHRLDTYGGARNQEHKQNNFPTGGPYGGHSYNILEGDLSQKDTWIDYAKLFCTDEVAERLLTLDDTWLLLGVNEGKNLSFVEGLDPETMYYYFPYSDTGAYEFGISEEYGLKSVSSDSFEISMEDDDHATVTYHFRPFAKFEWNLGEAEMLEPFDAELRYVKTADGWRLGSADFIEKLDASYAKFSMHLTHRRYSPPDTGDPVSVWYILTALIFTGSVLVKKKTFG